jgi:hypothetical protein
MDDDARSPPEVIAIDADDAGGGDRNEADADAAAEADDGVCAPKSMRDDDDLASAAAVMVTEWTCLGVGAGSSSSGASLPSSCSRTASNGVAPIPKRRDP